MIPVLKGNPLLLNPGNQKRMGSPWSPPNDEGINRDTRGGCLTGRI